MIEFTAWTSWILGSAGMALMMTIGAVAGGLSSENVDGFFAVTWAVINIPALWMAARSAAETTTRLIPRRRRARSYGR